MTTDLTALSVPVAFARDYDFKNDKFIKLRIRVCHDGRNRNGSFFSLDSFELAKDSLTNTPLIADVVFDEDGQPQFKSHDMHLEESTTGTRIVYDEVPIGLIPENCNYAIEQHNGRNYVCADAYVWRRYSNYAEDVFERDGDSEIAVSMEIDVQDFIYEKSKNLYRINSYTYMAVTCLGPDYEPGMMGAQATVATFSGSKKAYFTEMQKALKEELDKIYTQAAGEIKEGAVMSEEYSTVEEQDIPEEPTDEAEETVEETDSIEESMREDVPGEESEDKKKDFALETNLRDAINEALGSEVIEDSFWGTYPKYTLEDYDASTQVAYVYSYEDGHHYGIGFTVSGDAVTLHYDTRIRKVLDFRDYVPGLTPDTTGYNFTAYKDTLQQRYNEAIKEYEAEVAELREFKAKVEAEALSAARAEVLGEFTDLEKVEEFVALCNEADKYTDMEQLRTLCYAIRGKNIGAANNIHVDKKKLQFAHQMINPPKEDVGPSGAERILARYKDTH